MQPYSVLMSLYKKEHPDYLRQALDSMINQTVKPDEIVLVEDGPLTDELYQVVEEYKPYLRIVKNEKNIGLGLALNKGLKECRNELVARMDTDDISVLDRCEKQLVFLEKHPDVSIVGGQIEEFINDSHKVVGKRIVPTTDKEIKEYIKKRCPFNHVTVMFRKTDVLKAGNYRKCHYNEDYYLWIRMLCNNAIFANVGVVLVNVRVSEEMYQRRGGKKYFQSEYHLQRLMLGKKIIGMTTFICNVGKRIIVQIFLPNKARGWVFKKFARK